MMKWDVLPMTSAAEHTYNPIRAIVDVMDTRGNPDIPLIPLSIGALAVWRETAEERNAGVVGSGEREICARSHRLCSPAPSHRRPDRVWEHVCA